MNKIFGVILMLCGTVSLILLLNRQKKKRLETLSALMEFLRNLTYDVTDWKLPLEEAVLRRLKGLFPLHDIRTRFLTEKDRLGIRKALLFAIETEASVETAPKELIVSYLSELGLEKRTPTEELYHRVQTRLEEYYIEEKEECKAHRQLTVGTVGGISAAAMILLL